MVARGLSYKDYMSTDIAILVTTSATLTPCKSEDTNARPDYCGGLDVTDNQELDIPLWKFLNRNMHYTNC
jgi:hypothetical protein